jgi:hypothetical protein
VLLVGIFGGLGASELMMNRFLPFLSAKCQSYQSSQTQQGLAQKVELLDNVVQT